MNEKKISPLYKIIKALVRAFYPKMELSGLENVPEESVIVVGNHCQMHGPIVAELFYPGKRFTWCAGQMMELKEVPDYAYKDFWSNKPVGIRWFFRLLSYIIAPLSVCIFNNADTIPVYHDARLVKTFRRTMEKLDEGASVIIYPEHDVPYNHILSDFQDKFIDVARLYYRKTGRAICFVPMYISPALKKVCLGSPVRFCPDNSAPQERGRICKILMETITEMAESLPEHRVVPYNNIPRRRQGVNRR